MEGIAWNNALEERAGRFEEFIDARGGNIPPAPSEGTMTGAGRLCGSFSFGRGNQGWRPMRDDQT